jgi:hypothetical protein
MEIRPSGQIAIGVIAALGAIGALHFLVFAQNANDYSAAKQEYQASREQLNAAGKSPNPTEINKFRFATLDNRLRLWEQKSQLGVFMPDLYSEFLRTGDYNTALKAHGEDYWATHDKLVELRKAGEAGTPPKLSFLAPAGATWRFADALPPQLTSAGIQVEDEVSRLQNEDKLLNSLDPTSVAFQNRTNNYNRLLLRLGMDIRLRENIKTSFGEQAATFYTMNKIDLVRKALPEKFFGEVSPEEQLKQLYTLFRMEWPRDNNGNENPLIAYRHYKGLMLLIEKAQKAGISDITFVRTITPAEHRWTEPTAPGAAPTPDASMVGFDMGMGDFADPTMMEGGGDERGGGGGRFAGGGMGGGGGAATPEPAGEAVGFITPIEMHVVGSNAAVSTFLFACVNDTTPVELDKLRLRTNPAIPDVIEARCFFNIVAYANFSEGTKTDSWAKAKAVELHIDKAELAPKGGARELAIKSGFLIEKGENVELAVPSPTPWPATPTPVPTPAPPMSDMPAEESF